jgi:hypothetical protein
MKKYTDVDIIAELQKLVDSHVDSYKEDFDIDKRIIRRAAESQNPEDRTLMWFCRPHGTHCLNENQVFIQGTRDHNTFVFTPNRPTTSALPASLSRKPSSAARCSGMSLRSTTGNRRQMWRRTRLRRIMTG